MPQDQNTLIAELQARGMRVTPQRAIIFEVIERLSGHITAEEIFSEVQQINPYISLATVYRTLELLQELNLITPTNLGGSQTHFAMQGHGAHHHLVCQKCGGIEDFSDDLLETLRTQLETRYGFSAQINHFSIFGLCRACRQANPSAQPQAG
ncbi:MAG: transcriptional repressor [Chloroflexi bacterium]|nr:MAG: transcriptional repressor [Chloroflexota bacterium]